MTATKNFLVDQFVAGLALKAPCVAVSNANLTLSGLQTVDGVALAENDRVLVIAQTDPIENGIYDVSSSAWTRSADMDGNRDLVTGTLVTVISQSTSRFYKFTATGTITIDTTALTFELLGGLSAQTSPTWTSQAADFTAAAQGQYVVTAATVDIDVTLPTGLADGNQIAIHTDAASGFDVVVAVGSYTIRGPLGTVVSPDTLTISAGETVVLVSDGSTELEIV